MLWPKISTSWKKLAPTGRHGRHVLHLWGGDDEDDDEVDLVHESENLWTIVLFITHLSEVQKVFVQTPARSKFTQIE